ncbi:aldo/keto reductase [Kineosporia succinea]|uniref:Diketogulonate reductase-like aldo/keto reductase n=1 Tax=Kineosporia succinea TaxID=84632 RepID=A0ABT9PDJ0_9ACTN|nr:aldo/keto reductase [Kineosporia succinea]MDP9830783.1 diketogulonate reductase-like aldo/keto reductase [Kineosporia succinea]
MSSLTEFFTLSNGVQIHQLGFGTWQIPDGADTYDSVTTALKVGYRHIDTARAYGNEASVGRAVRDSGIPRDQIFITTKLPAEVKDYDQAHATFEESSSLLDLGPVDLYLIHAPWPWSEPGSDHRVGNVAVWKAMEELHEAGRIRSIGVSNFEVADLEALTSATRIRPHVNQIRWFIGNTQDETTAWCRANDILVEGYSPLATGAILGNPQVKQIADKYGRTVAQVSIRYLLEKGVLPLPKSTTPSRIAENADVDFTLEADDVAFLDGLTDTAN